MNIAGFGCGVVLDFFRVKLRHGFNIASLPADSLLNDGSRLLLACARTSYASATNSGMEALLFTGWHSLLQLPVRSAAAGSGMCHGSTLCRRSTGSRPRLLPAFPRYCRELVCAARGASRCVACRVARVWSFASMLTARMLS